METVRRIVTGVNEHGKAVIIEDAPARNTVYREALSVSSALVWVTDETPVDLAKYNDPAIRQTGVAPPPGGSILRVVDFHPAPKQIDNEAFIEAMGLSQADHKDTRHAFMHRTRSVDYAIVLSGEIDMLLDEGEVHMKAGDLLIQRGTNHAWVNRGDTVCRIVFVLIDAIDYPPPNGAPFPAEA
ncbi:MAG TPA: cupin domain-containing protein [Stellaceae bacterium]|nr:cupin domain-containing protein [Stellaceae bacterium]